MSARHRKGLEKMNTYSPYDAADARYYEDYASPSATPSPRRQSYHAVHPQTPQRPATRAHFRHMSSNDFASSTRRPDPRSPRYNSGGLYSTVDEDIKVSASRSTRKKSFSSPQTERERRKSFSYYRASDSHGESDEDEYIEVNGITYVIPARSSRPRRHVYQSQDYYYTTNVGGGHKTDRHRHSQATTTHQTEKDFYDSPRYEQQYTPREGDMYDEPQFDEARRSSHTRRSSTSMPQRPQTARPSSSHRKAKAAPPPAVRKATEADAKLHKIPAGYSLKNWDPTEEPILLLGSVFDANSLGKWIYDWTVFHHGPGSPIADMAGEMWLLLIQLAGKIKRAEQSVPKIRAKEKQEMVEDFIDSGERLTLKLRKLLKVSEAPMLKAASKKGGHLGKNSGVEFVETLFGRDREMDNTERFMQSIRLWNLRFDANCEDVLRNPTK